MDGGEQKVGEVCGELANDKSNEGNPVKCALKGREGEKKCWKWKEVGSNLIPKDTLILQRVRGKEKLLRIPSTISQGRYKSRNNDGGIHITFNIWIVLVMESSIYFMLLYY